MKRIARMDQRIAFAYVADFGYRIGQGLLFEVGKIVALPKLEK